MFEKVNPSHPDKVADRIAGAIVDLAYTKQENPKIAVEVLIGHGNATVVIETSVVFLFKDIEQIVKRIAGNDIKLYLQEIPQDQHLADNQRDKIRCGDNGIFKGTPVTLEQVSLSYVARKIYSQYGTDGKYIIDGRHLIVCQSNADSPSLLKKCSNTYSPDIIVNPIGEWTGGTDVDTGATNRKLGSDMGDAVTGGGLHGKDLSKADVSVNIYAHIKAQKTGEPVELFCAIGDETVDGRPYSEIVEIAKEYIKDIGGFEKFAEWGLI